jgi:hypothetical protein
MNAFRRFSGGAAPILCAALLCTSSGAMFAQAAKPAAYRAPRTDDGKPDLQGIWQAHNTAAYNLEDHSASLGVPGGRGVVIDPADGKIPYRPEALKIREQHWNTRKTSDPLGKCFLPGVPRVMYLPFPFQIFQTEDFVIIASEFAHTTRTIHLKGEHPEELDFWMGDSRGHWEGETLVVDVADNNANTWFDQSGNFHSEQLHITERFTRTAPDILTYEATLEDPKVFTKPWKISMPFELHKEKDFQLLEYECHVYLADEEAAKEEKK